MSNTINSSRSGSNMDVELRHYREGDDGITALCYQPGTAAWISADGLGNLYTVTATSKSEINVSEIALTAIALKATMGRVDDEVGGNENNRS